MTTAVRNHEAPLFQFGASSQKGLPRPASTPLGTARGHEECVCSKSGCLSPAPTRQSPDTARMPWPQRPFSPRLSRLQIHHGVLCSPQLRSVADAFEVLLDGSTMVADDLQKSTFSIADFRSAQELQLPLQSLRVPPNFADDRDVLRSILSLDDVYGQVV